MQSKSLLTSGCHIITKLDLKTHTVVVVVCFSACWTRILNMRSVRLYLHYSYSHDCLYHFNIFSSWQICWPKNKNAPSMTLNIIFSKCTQLHFFFARRSLCSYYKHRNCQNLGLFWVLFIYVTFFFILLFLRITWVWEVFLHVNIVSACRKQCHDCLCAVIWLNDPKAAVLLNTTTTSDQGSIFVLVISVYSGHQVPVSDFQLLTFTLLHFPYKIINIILHFSTPRHSKFFSSSSKRWSLFFLLPCHPSSLSSSFSLSSFRCFLPSEFTPPLVKIWNIRTAL